MSDDAAPLRDDEDSAQTLAEMAARRLAARSQWQKALARARERFAPANLRDEAIDSAATTLSGAADKGAALAWAHRGKIALAGLLGGLFLARKPIAEVARPLAAQTKGAVGRTIDKIKARKR